MNAGLDFALAQVRDRDLVIESLREQLAVHERWIDSYGHPEEWVKRAQAAHGRAEAAEAKLAEVQERLDFANAYKTRLQVKVADAEAKLAEVERILNKSVTSRKATEKRLAEVEKERDELRVLRRGEQKRAENLEASMDRARELAEKYESGLRVPSFSDMAQIARLLGGDDEPK